MDCPDIPSETTTTAVVFSVGLHSLAEGSHLMTDHLFQLLKQHLGGHKFHNNNELGMSVGESA
jgi:hypothetical protein